MKRRTALLIGFAVGYVLGAQAGRERYEQIRNMARTITENALIKQFLDEAMGLADAGTAKARGTLGDHLKDASSVIRDKVG